MKTLIVKEISDVMVEKARKDSKQSRQYYVLTCSEKGNPFKPAARRVMFQDYDNLDKPYWKIGDPQDITLRMEIAGEIVTEQVAEYAIGENVVNTYTTFIFEHEKRAQVFKSLGHPIDLGTQTIPSDALTPQENPFS